MPPADPNPLVEFSRTIDVSTLSAVILAALLAVQGFVQRSAARRAAAAPVVCPNKVDALVPALEALAREVQASRKLNEEGRGVCRDLRDLIAEIRTSEERANDSKRQKLDEILRAVERVERKVE